MIEKIEIARANADFARSRADTLARRLSAARRLLVVARRFTDGECQDEAVATVSRLQEDHARALEAVADAENRLAQIRVARELGLAS